MKRTVRILAVVAAALLAYVRWVPSGDFMLGGIQVNEPDHDAWTAALEADGFDTVEVTVYARQGDWDTAELWWEDEEPWVVEEMRSAKRRGLKVALILRVALDHAYERNRFFWHGMILPQGDAALGEWFDRYRRFVERWATIAAAEGVDLLAVGSEMSSLASTLPVAEVPGLEEYWANEEKVEREQAKVAAHAETIDAKHLWTRGFDAYDSLDGFLDAEAAAQAAWARRAAFLDAEDPVAAINAHRARLDGEWREVAAVARAAFSGPLTYAANFDQYDQVGFWDALDVVGVNAYFPLRGRFLEDGDGLDLEPILRARWATLLREIDRVRRERGVPDHPVVFTELGYVARRNSTLRPWAADGFAVLPSAAGDRLVVWPEQPHDREERAAAIRALYQAHLDVGGDLLAGILYWKLTTDPGHEAIEPFALVVGDRAPHDPMRDALVSFREDLRWDRLRAALPEWARFLLPPKGPGGHG